MASKRRDWGRIRQLKSGRWQARYPGPDGLLRPADNTFETRKDAARWLSNKQTEIENADWVDPDAGRVPFIAYATTWISERDLSDTTRERYESILRKHFPPILGELNLADIREATVRRWRKDRLDNNVGRPTVAKAYRLLHAIYATAVDDQVVKRNPCRIKGAGDESAPERPTLSIRQVITLADTIAPRYRVLVLLASMTSLRFGELAALRRRDVDLVHGEVHVRHSQAELQGGRLLVKDPKSEAGKRTVAIPAVILPDVREHLRRFAADGLDGRVFVGPLGGVLRRHNFRKLWRAAVAAAPGVPEIHFHDLRHTGNQLAAVSGATTKELMARMGHSTMRAALIYQHATRERDRAIAKNISQSVRKAQQKPQGKRARKRARKRPEGHAGGTQPGSAA
jgi:integrase